MSALSTAILSLSSAYDEYSKLIGELSSTQENLIDTYTSASKLSEAELSPDEADVLITATAFIARELKGAGKLLTALGYHANGCGDKANLDYGELQSCKELALLKRLESSPSSPLQALLTKDN